MSNHPNRSRACRPREMLRDLAGRYPYLFDAVSAYRAEHYAEWPGWCYCPSGLAYAAVLQGGLNVAAQATAMAALHNPALDGALLDAELAPILAAWRMGMGVYRFDETLAAALVATPSDALPAEILRTLPEWCVYVETPFWRGEDVEGFFAMPDHDEIPTLRIVFDRRNAQPATYPLPLDKATVAQSLAAHMEFTLTRLPQWMQSSRESVKRAMRDGGALAPHLPACISLLLYLCSDEPDYADDERPRNPRPVKTKKGWRLFPASAPRIWEIGRTIGERLRTGQPTPSTGERATPAPHLRRAHWHTFRVGKGRVETRVRWLHPILVGYGEAGQGE